MLLIKTQEIKPPCILFILYTDAPGFCSLPGDGYQGFAGMDEREGPGLFGQQPDGQENSANGSSASQGGISVPDFLPPAQRVLFMRIQQKQQEEEERARRIAEGGTEKVKETEGTKDFYSTIYLNSANIVFINK